MNSRFEKYIENAKEVKLTSAEKTTMLNSLREFVDAHPIEEVVPSPFLFSFVRYRSLVGVLAAVFLIVFGTTSAAGYSLPGDILYPVKINVNEKVKGYIASARGAKAEFETGLAFERLKEAENEFRKIKIDE